MQFALGLRRVCVGLLFHVLPAYCLTTVCLIIHYRNSGNLRVQVQGTYSARCCQRFSTITLTSDALLSLRRSAVLHGSAVSRARTHCSSVFKIS